MVTVMESVRILVQLGPGDTGQTFFAIGFQPYHSFNVLAYKSEDEAAVFRMAERLRDMNVPFSTHRHGGADYGVEFHRERGQLSGRFLRICFAWNDYDYSGPFTFEWF